MKLIRILSLCSAVLWPALGAAQAVDGLGGLDESVWAQRLGLPPVTSVRASLAASARVLGARAGLDEARARRQRLQAGPYEWTIRAGVQRRTETAGPEYVENELALERTVRWGGKAQADSALGDATLDAARLAYADTWHETARDLLQAWYDWQRARSVARVQAQQTQLAQEQLQLARRRVQAGDVAHLDAMSAEAEYQRMWAQQQLDEGQAESLAQALHKRYPGLATGADAGALAAATAADAQLPGDTPQWIARILQENHELELAEAQLRQARLVSERAGLDRRPDPLLGVRAARERGGQDNVIGVYVAVPLGGSFREAEQGIALAQQAAAEQRLAATRQKVEAAAQEAVLRAERARAAWDSLVRAERAMAQVAQLAMKAYGLGEVTLPEALQSRRLAVEAALRAEEARWDALYAASRVLVDAHQLLSADAAQ